MKLNTEYLEVTGLVIGSLIWIVAVIALLSLFVLSIVNLNFGFIAISVVALTVFVYLTVMVCDKLDFL